MSLIPASFRYQEFKPYEWNNELVQIKSVVNGEISFGTGDGKDRNMSGERLQVTFTAANADQTFNHDLKSIPIGYLALTSSNGGVIYNGSLQETDWTNTTITLRSTTANNIVSLFILGK